MLLDLAPPRVKFLLIQKLKKARYRPSPIDINIRSVPISEINKYKPFLEKSVSTIFLPLAP